jgi:hypothetical protein
MLRVKHALHYLDYLPFSFPLSQERANLFLLGPVSDLFEADGFSDGGDG